ncbi:P-loop containing nucleoside triphosphate hydrolase protein, partial [Globomyces pollinis-pini]
RPNPTRVYINLNAMETLNLNIGDFLIVESGNGKTLGIAWPSLNVKLPFVTIPSPILDNLNIKENDVITINSNTNQLLNANSITLKSLNNQDFKPDVTLTMYLKEVLMDIEYVMHLQIIQVEFNGQSQRFQIVADKYPNNVFRVIRTTDISIITHQKSLKNDTTNSFDNIGGLKNQITAIREMIEFPLLQPERFHKFGLSPPKGLLLYGPPGTGKTLIARAVASETGAHVIVVNGPEIMSKFYGETELKLKQIFDEAAENSPSIIFFDEIDCLCPKRDDSHSDLEKRVVASLLTLMDGAQTQQGGEAPKIFVIGATNRPNSIDPALRRPGRFDREFEIGIPNANERFDILKKLCQKIHHNLTDEELGDVSCIAHGYVGADLAAVCREAGLQCIKRVQREAGTEISDDALENDTTLIITKDDMINGMNYVKPSVVREIMLEVPKVYWDEIGGQEEIKQKLKEAVEWPLKHPEKFLKFNIRPPKGVLLYGPPGCSKTLMAKALATEAGLNFLAVKGPELFSKWVGESEKAVQQIFKKARAASPSIIFFDEIDALAVRRAGQESSVGDRVLSQLLNEMDGIEPLVNVTIIAATNRPDILDSALLRPGRIDSILYVSPPDFKSREAIFKIQLKKIPHEDSIDISELSRLSEGFSGAETVAVCQNAALLAMQEDINTDTVLESHFLKAIRSTTKQISNEMLEFYRVFRNRSGLRSV